MLTEQEDNVEKNHASPHVTDGLFSHLLSNTPRTGKKRSHKHERFLFRPHVSPLVDTAHVAATRVDTAELVPHWAVSTMEMHLISPRRMWRAAQLFAVTQRKYMERVIHSPEGLRIY